MNVQHFRLAEVLQQKNRPDSCPKDRAHESPSFSAGSLSKRQVGSVADKCKICLCEGVTDPKRFLTACEHRSNFCASCLYSYTVCRANQFQEVTCPEIGCKEKIDLNLNFYSELPESIKVKVKKVQQFYAALSDPFAQICPG